MWSDILNNEKFIKVDWFIFFVNVFKGVFRSLYDFFILVICLEEMGQDGEGIQLQIF